MMADTIEVVTTVELVAWPVPDFVCIGSSDVSEDGVHLVSIFIRSKALPRLRWTPLRRDFWKTCMRADVSLVLSA